MSDTELRRLINYIIIVGPSATIPEHQSSPGIPSLTPTSPPPVSRDGGWDAIYKPGPAILRRFPEADLPDQPLIDNVVYFCQPEGCVGGEFEKTSHIFMLTNTETNIRTYGCCISLPYLVDPLARAQSHDWKFENQDSVSIQEWGVLSICLLSQHEYFNFFNHCLKTIIHFVEHFCGSKLTWDLLIHSKFVSQDDTNYVAIRELENWIESLIALPTPKPGIDILEVELEVDPAIIVGCPPPTRLPIFNLPVYVMFEQLEIYFVIEIYKLLLMEQKIILHSRSYEFVSQCVMTIQGLLYPLQYLFPVIPLLPTCLPNAENLLLVPTPYFIGVSSTFLKKLDNIHRTETWIIDLDKKEISEPTQYKPPKVEFPVSIHTLQADIHRSLDKLDNLKDKTIHYSSDNIHEEYPSVENEVDVLIRLAFVEFLFCPDMMGLLENHLTIYRLFPRPVVSLKRTSFINDYMVRKGDKNTDEFINTFMRSQSVEYYLEWSLNPNNRAFEEIRKGFCEVDRISDKLAWWIQKSHPRKTQYTIYSPDTNSILYQEMLNYKATQATHLQRTISTNSDDSEFEIIGLEYCDVKSDNASSYFSDGGSLPSMTDVAAEVVPVAVEFHPPTPDEMVTITKSINPIFDGVNNETFLPLHTGSEANGTNSSSSPDQHQPLPPTPIPTGDKEETSIILTPSLNDASFHTPMTDIEAVLIPPSTYETPNGNTDAAIEIFQTPSMNSDAHFKTPYSDNATQLEVSETNSDTLLELFQTPKYDTTSSNSEFDFPVRSPLHISNQLFLYPPTNENLIMKQKTVDRGSPSPEPGIPRSGSWMNLKGQPTAVEMLEFSTPIQSRDGSEDIEGEHKEMSGPVIRSVPWSSVSSLHELETQIKDIVRRIGAGQGLPWPKSQVLKTIATDERSRVALLRVLEVRVGTREQTETNLSANGEIRPVAVSKMVYKGVLDLLKYLMQFIEAELAKEIETRIFSIFLIFRLALCLCTSSSHRRVHSTKSHDTKENKSPESKTPLSPRSSSVPVMSVVEKGSSSLPTTIKKQSRNRSEKEIWSEDEDHGTDNDQVIKTPAGNGKTQQIELKEMAGDFSGQGGKNTPTKRVRVSSPTPQDERDSSYVYLHNDLIKSLGPNVKNLVVKRQFWNNLFACVVEADRKYLGWNEKTPELYDRYNSLPLSKRQEFSYKEDTLLSVILHNILVFLLMVGVSPFDTLDLCHRLSAKTRLATAEEKLLQQTLRELEAADLGNHIDVRDLAVLSLYSETHSIIVYVVHHGISVISPIYKLQITDEVCILRRFPDERIAFRFWNDRISKIDYDYSRMTVTFLYQESEEREYFHHFHSKQFKEVFQSLQTLVSPQ